MHRKTAEMPLNQPYEGQIPDNLGTWQFSPDSFDEFYEGPMEHERHEIMSMENPLPMPPDAFRPVKVEGRDKAGVERRSSLTLMLKSFDGGCGTGTTSKGQYVPSSHGGPSQQTATAGDDDYESYLSDTSRDNYSPITTVIHPSIQALSPPSSALKKTYHDHTDTTSSTVTTTSTATAKTTKGGTSWDKIIAAASSDSEDDDESSSDDDAATDGEGQMSNFRSGFQTVLGIGSDGERTVPSKLHGKVSCLNFDPSPTKSMRQKLREKEQKKSRKGDTGAGEDERGSGSGDEEGQQLPRGRARPVVKVRFEMEAASDQRRPTFAPELEIGLVHAGRPPEGARHGVYSGNFDGTGKNNSESTVKGTGKDSSESTVKGTGKDSSESTVKGTGKGTGKGNGSGNDAGGAKSIAYTSFPTSFATHPSTSSTLFSTSFANSL